MIASVLLTVFVCVLGIIASPVSQHQQQQVQGYNSPPQYYLQQIQNQQPQYISAPPIPQAPTPLYEGAPQHQVSQQFIPQSPPTQRVSQLLLPSAADRQVQKAAEQIAGPEYAQQVQIAQQQGLANLAVATAERRALRRAQLLAQQRQQAQQAQLAQHQTNQHQQYLTEVSPKPQYLQVQIPQQQYQQRQAPAEQYESQQQQYEVQYQPQYNQPTAKPHRAINSQVRGNQQREKEVEPEEEHDNNASYQFGFDVKDDLYTNYQNRKEQREGGKISGSYSVVDSDGFIRTVTYTADPKEGFKAEVVREPTDIVVKVPKPKEQPQQPHQQYIQTAPAQRYQQQQQREQPQEQQYQKQQIVYQYQ